YKEYLCVLEDFRVFCSDCKKRFATVHITKVVNNNVAELHLCSLCANKKFGPPENMLQPQFYLPNIIANLINATAANQAQVQYTRDKCPVCGYSFTDFINTGLLGCSNCYSIFSSELKDIIRKVHGSTEHTGKILKRRHGGLKTNRSVEDLKKQLAEAVKKEEYEKAARIRDKINAQKKKETKK
ncbi:MAG: UvrB/UvrC motif-containing protein, partial [Armatimonadota bacterium]